MTVSPRRSAVCMATAAALSLLACSDSQRPPMNTAYVSLHVLAPPYVARIALVVRAADIADSIVFNVPVVSGTAYDTIELRAGSGRQISAKAFDEANAVTHQADTTITLLPGMNPTLRLVLQPLVGTLPVEITFGSVDMILFESSRSGRQAIWRVNPDGTGLRMVTADTVAVHEGTPAPSPDGRTVAFYRDDAGTWRMNLAGGARILLASNGGAGAGTTWSPDGSEILYQSVADCGEDLYGVKPDGSGQRVVVDAGVDIAEQTAQHPSWSVGGKIAFVGRTCNTASGTLYYVNRDRTALTSVLSNVAYARWSADGSRLALQRWDGANYQVWTMLADGSELTQLTSEENNGAPTWSPDGAEIAFSRTVAGVTGCTLWRMNADGSGPQQITTGTSCDTKPVWIRVQ